MHLQENTQVKISIRLVVVIIPHKKNNLVLNLKCAKSVI